MNEKIYIYETDTVWGIGAPIGHQSSVEKVALIKNRDLNQPCSILCSSIEMLGLYCDYQKMGISVEWLSDFFKMETSLLFPHKYSRDIPSYIVGDSSYVSIRVLTYPWLKKICEWHQSAITTTSLNRSGQKAIVSLEEAIAFKENYAPNSNLVLGKDHLSGQSSTMVKLDSLQSFEIVREGNRIKDVQRQLSLLST